MKRTTRDHGIASLGLLTALLCGGASCGSPPQPARAGAITATATATAQTAFRAVLFPYIPDSAGDNFAALIDDLEAGFEAQHPTIDLQVVIDANLDLYDYAPGGTLSKLFGSGSEAAQVVEVDTLLMTTLVDNRWVQPIAMANPGTFETAWQAATVDGITYGAPTYLCSNVIYAFSNTITSATSATNLIARLSAIKAGVPPLVGNYAGSWTLPSFYVDAWADTNGTPGLATSYDLPLDQRTMSFFPTVVNSCVSGGKNPCLDNSYSGTQAETLMATGAANGFIGYTERLFFIRTANPSAPLPAVASDAIGGGTHPTMFVDALAFNPSCTGTCLSTAQAFATYMSSVAVRNLIAFSQDGPPGTLPRYLLQANQSFYRAEPAASDPMYQRYLPIAQAAQPFPNTTFPQSRGALQAALLAALGAEPRATPSLDSPHRPATPTPSVSAAPGR